MHLAQAAAHRPLLAHEGGTSSDELASLPAATGRAWASCTCGRKQGWGEASGLVPSLLLLLQHELVQPAVMVHLPTHLQPACCMGSLEQLDADPALRTLRRWRTLLGVWDVHAAGLAAHGHLVARLTLLYLGYPGHAVPAAWTEMGVAPVEQSKRSVFLQGYPPHELGSSHA